MEDTRKGSHPDGLTSLHLENIDSSGGGGGDNWSYKMCKAAVKSSPPTNQHPVIYRPGALPVTQQTVSEH